MAVISFQPNNIQDRIFAKSKRSASGFAFALIFSLVLMVIDCHYRYLEIVRVGLSLIVSPVQYVVDYPVRVIGWVRSMVGTKKALIDENMQLRYQQTILEAKMQKLLMLSNENSQLKELLSAASAADMHAMAAQILAVDMSSARQLLVLDKGKRDGLVVGQPVLDAKGVMGQIIDVGLMTSTVLLISDAKSAVPVRDDRTGELAILVGINRIGELSLINLPKTSEIKRGDILVTSGLGRRYPEGYPVGRVEEVKNIPGEEFIKVRVSPMAKLNRSRLVLIAALEEDHAALTDQINERLNIMDEITWLH